MKYLSNEREVGKRTLTWNVARVWVLLILVVRLAVADLVFHYAGIIAVAVSDESVSLDMLFVQVGHQRFARVLRAVRLK